TDEHTERTCAPVPAALQSRPMIRIASVTLREVRLPLIQPFRSAGGEGTARRVLLVEMTDGDGHSAWSECVAQQLPAYSPDTIDTCWFAISEWLARRLLMNPLDGARGAFGVLSSEVQGHRMAIAALEMGAWALQAVRDGVPLASLLARNSACMSGGTRQPRRVVESGVAIGLQDHHRVLAELARTAVLRGYRRIRMKIMPGHDVHPVRAVLQAVGSEVPVIADANGSYSPDDSAHAGALAELDSLGLHMLEQPLPPDEHVRLADLQARMTTPICRDESLRS